MAGAGRYRATYNATKSGKYLLEVVDVSEGEHAVGSPFEVFVEPSQAFAPATLVWWDRQVRCEVQRAAPVTRETLLLGSRHQSHTSHIEQ